MRNYTLNIRLSAVLVAPLLVACGSVNQGGSNYVQVPDCGGVAGQVLTTDTTGQLVCKNLPAGAVSLPACVMDIEALTADGMNLFCTPRNVVDQMSQASLTTLTMIEKQIIDYGMQITKVGAGPGAQAIYVGPSSKTTTGRITYNTSTPGIQAAAAQCASDYGAGAHMCTVYELYYSTALLKNVDAAADIGASWTYMQSWKTPGSGYPSTATVYPKAVPTVPDPYAGLSDNCGGYTSATPGGDNLNQWTGTAFRYITNTTMVRVPKFFADTSCGSSLPIACCK